MHPHRGVLHRSSPARRDVRLHSWGAYLGFLRTEVCCIGLGKSSRFSSSSSSSSSSPLDFFLVFLLLVFLPPLLLLGFLLSSSPLLLLLSFLSSSFPPLLFFLFPSESFYFYLRRSSERDIDRFPADRVLR